MIKWQWTFFIQFSKWSFARFIKILITLYYNNHQKWGNEWMNIEFVLNDNNWTFSSSICSFNIFFLINRNLCLEMKIKDGLFIVKHPYKLTEWLKTVLVYCCNCCLFVFIWGSAKWISVEMVWRTGHNFSLELHIFHHYPFYFFGLYFVSMLFVNTN